MKRHRWREDGEHAERCRDCLLRRERIDPGDGRERWFWPVVWTWTPPRGDGRERRRINGQSPTCPPSPDDWTPGA